MDGLVDHYVILGLPSGEEGSKFSEKEITKAYRLKALELHPDKRPNDPNAAINFQKLQTSYQILRDEKTREAFDDDIIRRTQQKNQQDCSNRRRTMSDEYSYPSRRVYDFVQRCRAAFARSEQERIHKEEIHRIRELQANEHASAVFYECIKLKQQQKLNKEKILKVSWAKVGLNYSAERLREIFEMFGEVEDVVRSSKKIGLALVVMANKEAAAAATQTLCGDPSNPLRVKPLRSVSFNN